MKNNSVGPTVLGIAATAAAVGAAAYMMKSRRNNNMKKIRKNAEKTVHAMGSIVDGISEIVR